MSNEALKQYLKYLWLLIIILINSCIKSERKIIPSIYHWKQTFHLTKFEADWLAGNQIRKIYVRFFDIKLMNGRDILPVSSVKFEDKIDTNLVIIPVVYIENDVFAKLQEVGLDTLARKLVNRIRDIENKNGLISFQEIQIDCDWTAGSKDNYFNLLKLIKSMIGDAKLSCTLRLHQFKYAPKTGIPPVDEITLMYYNMSRVQDMKTYNSILDNTEGEKYTKGAAEYPLHINIALPIFSWGVLFQNGSLSALLPGLNDSDLIKMGAKLTSGNHIYRFEKDTVLQDKFIRKGDILRLEEITFKELKRAAEICISIVPKDQNSINITFYHLDSVQLHSYDVHQFKKILDTFR